MKEQLAKSPLAVVSRSTPKREPTPVGYRPTLRRDFHFACAYCGMTECESLGAGFQVEHYYPKSKYPRLALVYNNLYWACEACNRYKAAFSPTREQRRRGLMVLRPDRVNPDDHVQAKPDFTVTGLTQTGEFTIDRVELNRPEARKIREIRWRLFQSRDTIANGLRTLLQYRIDDFRGAHRRTYTKLRRAVLEEQENLEATMDAFLAAVSRSPLLDAKEELSRRAKYLAEHHAIGADYDPKIRAGGLRRVKKERKKKGKG